MARVIGVDLGTSYCSAGAFVDGRPVVVPSAEGTRRVASIVAYARNGDVLAGAAAQHQAVRSPERAVRAVKQLLGSDRPVEVGGAQHSPPEIAAHLLTKLRRDAETFLREPVDGVVLTVPAYGTVARRRALREAAALAGLTVHRLLSEPAAAALPFGWSTATDEQTALIVDLGGGGLSVAVVEWGEDVVEVRAMAGEPNLGGAAWDERITGHLVQTFRGMHGIDLAQDPAVLPKLARAAEQAKIDLTATPTATASVPYVAAGPLHLDVRLSRADLAGLTQDLLDRVRAVVEQVFVDGGGQVLDHVIAVGGAARMPAVTELLHRLTGRAVTTRVRRFASDETVTVGAALRAGASEGQLPGVTLIEKVALPFGVEVNNGIMHRLVERNSTLPARRSELYTTAHDRQRSVLVRVFEGERDITANNTLLGGFVLNGLRPAPHAVPQIEITIDVNEDGLPDVRARELPQGAVRSLADGPVPRHVDPHHQLMLPRTGGLNELAVTRERADELRRDVERFLADLGDRVRPDLRAELDAALDELHEARDGGDIDLINVAHERVTAIWKRAGTPSRAPVFISYSRSDQSYVDDLAAHLVGAGIPVWYDHSLLAGDRWTDAIRAQIDACAALLVVMTPAAERSNWVNRELNYAEQAGKQIMPLLRSGGAFFRLSELQYDDVSDGRMPTPGLLARLQALTDR